MKKFMLCFAVMFCMVMVSQARDIKTKDGKVYKDVTFFTVSPDGIDIEYKKDGENYLRHFYFVNLPEDIQKEFKYSPEKAEAYSKELTKIHKIAQEKLDKKLKAEKAADAATLALRSRIEAGSINVVLKIYSAQQDGVVAWASSKESTVTTGHMGKIFVLGMQGLSGGEAASQLYPTGTTRDGYAVYSPYLDVAVAIAKQNGTL